MPAQLAHHAAGLSWLLVVAGQGVAALQAAAVVHFVVVVQSVAALRDEAVLQAAKIQLAVLTGNN